MFKSVEFSSVFTVTSGVREVEQILVRFLLLLYMVHWYLVEGDYEGIEVLSGTPPTLSQTQNFFSCL